MSCYGSGDFRPARVVRTHRAEAAHGIAITTPGRRIVSTEDHIHFAGFVVGRTPQLHLTYVMWKQGMGFRSARHAPTRAGDASSVRCAVHPGARRRHVGRGCPTEAEAGTPRRRCARYGLPTLPFVARGTADRSCSLVGNQELIDRLFAELDTDKRGPQLLADHGLHFEHPHHLPHRTDRSEASRDDAVGRAVR